MEKQEKMDLALHNNVEIKVQTATIQQHDNKLQMKASAPQPSCKATTSEPRFIFQNRKDNNLYILY